MYYDNCSPKNIYKNKHINYEKKCIEDKYHLIKYIWYIEKKQMNLIPNKSFNHPKTNLFKILYK